MVRLIASADFVNFVELCLKSVLRAVSFSATITWILIAFFVRKQKYLTFFFEQSLPELALSLKGFVVCL